MAIKIYPATKVYAVAPANVATGGPELLHQLVYHLREDLDIDAYIYYVPSDHSNPVHPEYKLYNDPFVRNIEDSDKNILIVPEVITGIKVLREYRKIRKIIWWLSVDNFYLSYILGSRRHFFFQRAINKLFKLWGRKPIFDLVDLVYQRYSINNGFKPDQFLKDFILKADFHLAQSYYAVSHLKDIGIPHEKIFYLSDYLNEDFLKTQTDLSKKENIVVYNPKKGFSFTKKIIKAAPDIKFVPIINMTRKQVIESLQEAKVYIDFGNHPGKDRIPREAAILGCCVITGKRGSTRYFEDVSIPEEYKFEDKTENISSIVIKIKDCFTNFKKRYKDFEYYRNVIKKEPQKFIEDIRKIFKFEE